MTERTIRHLAMELAGTFYEQKRSDRFRSRDSLTKAKRLVRHAETGLLVEVDVTVKFFEAYPTAHKFAVAHWPLFYDAARRCLVTMLAKPEARPQHLNDAIMAALVEDRDKQVKHGGQLLIQRDATDHVEDKAARRIVRQR